jgi:hypothetical protein
MDKQAGSYSGPGKDSRPEFFSADWMGGAPSVMTTNEAKAISTRISADLTPVIGELTLNNRGKAASVIGRGY